MQKGQKVLQQEHSASHVYGPQFEISVASSRWVSSN